jgi:alanine racemase
MSQMRDKLLIFPNYFYPMSRTASHPVSRPLHCEVSIAALRHNFECAREAANCPSDQPKSASVKVWSVVKANAYGHGLEAAIVAFAESHGLALLEFDYAVRLRELGWKKPLLMLEGAFGPDDTQLARDLDLTLAVHQMRQLDWLVDTTAGGGLGDAEAVNIWIKLNTGMNRLGFATNEVATVIARLNEMTQTPQYNVTLAGLMTHFANSDLAPHESTHVGVPVAKQRALYNEAFSAFKKYWPNLSISMANSSAVVGYPAIADDLLQSAAHEVWVRPGVMLYGATPYADLQDQGARALGLKAAMALKSQIIAVQKIGSGDSIGYGSRFTALSDMTIGIVAGGYADGYPRHAPDGTPVWLLGQRTRLVGRVSMDMLVIDITQVAGAGIGTEVELWGAHLPIDDVAQPCGTIGYELMCAVAERVARKTVLGFLE